MNISELLIEKTMLKLSKLAINTEKESLLKTVQEEIINKFRQANIMRAKESTKNVELSVKTAPEKKHMMQKKTSKVPEYQYRVTSPDELIQGMSEYVRQCGFTSNFLEQEKDHWKLLTNVMTNPSAPCYKVFWENVQPHV